MKNNYSPDILNCLANLSSDEVFTSPELANRMLDLLPQELFRSSKTRFLDPCSKSGVFLREIAKRLLAGLEEQIPDLQQRIDHIMTKQVFGIACTDLTAEMSRRTLYCTKQANGEYSVSTAFDDVQGNLRYLRCQHTWENGKCKYCGANRSQYDRVATIESYAYPFLHNSIKEIFHKNMQFDVILGNPPYQLEDGGARASAKPIYQLFVEQAQKIKPRYLVMIIPARWYSGGKGLDAFRENMITCGKIRVLVDYFDATECFPGIDLSGGVCYFLWDRDNKGLCEVTNVRRGEIDKKTRNLSLNGSFVRFNKSVSIVQKVQDNNFQSFSSMISSRKPFGLETNVAISKQKKVNSVTLYAYPENGYVEKTNVIANKEWIDKWKVYVSYAYGERGDFPYYVIGKPFLGKKNTCCTETYLVVGPMEEKLYCENVMSYMRTKFFRFLVLQKKNTQHATSKVYSLVPMQDFSHPWTDEMLYKKYDLDKDEIAFIESMIRPME